MDDIRAELGKMGWMVFRANVGLYLDPKTGNRISTGLPVGFPDLFACKDGRTVFIETKVRPRKPTREQVAFLDAMRRSGFTAVVAYSVEDAVSAVESDSKRHSG